MTSPEARPRCDLILVSYNQLDYTKACLESFVQCTPETAVDWRLLIVDNGSGSDVVASLREFAARHPRVEVRANAENLGWVTAVNQGLAWAAAPYVGWLNNDLVFLDGWLGALLRVAEAHPRIGLLNPSWRLHHETLDMFRQRVATERGRANHNARYLEVGECNGSCLVVRREVLERVGGLDEEYGSGGLDDADFSRRAARAGFLCVQVEDAFVFHWENVSSNAIPGYWERERPQKRRLFEERWGPPRTIAVVWDARQMDRETGREAVRRLLALVRLGLRVQLVVTGAPRRAVEAKSHEWGLEAVRHANLKIRWVRWPSVLPCVGLIASHRGKDDPKRFKAVVVPSLHQERRLRALRWVHGVPVYPSFEACPLLRNDVAWLSEGAGR